jgi:hypothetical protein
VGGLALVPTGLRGSPAALEQSVAHHYLVIDVNHSIIGVTRATASALPSSLSNQTQLAALV